MKSKMDVFKLLLALVSLAAGLLATDAYAQEGSSLGSKPTTAKSYTGSVEDFGGGTHQEWFAIRSGGLMAAKELHSKNYQVGLNTKLGGLVGKDLGYFDRIQIELRADSRISAYSLLGIEWSIPHMHGWNMFTAAVISDSGKVRPVFGPIWYWGEKSYSLLFAYAGVRDDGKFSGALSLRNRLYVFGDAHLIADATPKMVGDEYAMAYKVGAAGGPLSVTVEETPFWEGTDAKRKAAMVSLTLPW